MRVLAVLKVHGGIQNPSARKRGSEDTGHRDGRESPKGDTVRGVRLPALWLCCGFELCANPGDSQAAWAPSQRWVWSHNRSGGLGEPSASRCPVTFRRQRYSFIAR